MTGPTDADRRTVLKTTGAVLAGGGLLTGTASGARSGGGSALAQPNVVDITATHDHESGEHGFELSTTETPVGWTGFRLDNATEHTHFAYLGKVPQVAIDAANEADRDLLDFYVEHVTRPFQFVMDDIDPDREPDPADLSDRYSNPEEGVIFPSWFTSVLPSGGPGFTSPGTTSATTVNLAPGEYIVECYVKDAEGVFHSYEGMIEHLTVTGGNANAAEPGATLDVTLSTAGIDAPDTVRAGQHTVGVEIRDQKVYSHLLGHDLHLVRLDDATPADLNGWMNWMGPEQLVSDGSEPGTFLGGAQTVLTPALLGGKATERAYIHVDLQPGDYALVSEVPSPMDKGFLHEFTVSESAGAGRGPPPADPGSSRNWGVGGEAADDDLSASAAGSRMPDWLKTMFDDVANLDAEDLV